MKMRPVEIADEDHELVVERVRAIDVAKRRERSACACRTRAVRAAYQQGVGRLDDYGVRLPSWPITWSESRGLCGLAVPRSRR